MLTEASSASESGNAEALALKTKKLAQKNGLDARVIDMADTDVSILSKAKNLIVFASTWGEGDPPSRTVDFYESLMGDDAPQLEDVRFAVLALGDTAYAQFCATGKAIDARLEALGGKRVADRVDLDLGSERERRDSSPSSADRSESVSRGGRPASCRFPFTRSRINRSAATASSALVSPVRI